MTHHGTPPPPVHPARLPPAVAARLAELPVRRGYERYGDLGQPLGLDCRCCDARLVAWAPDANLPVVHRRAPDGTVILEIPQTYRPTPAYALVVLELEDAAGTRSAHVTTCCGDCASGLDLATAEAIYLSDLEQAALEDEAKGVPVAETRRVLDRMASRSVRRVLEIRRLGGG